MTHNILEPIFEKINKSRKKPLIIAIDGRCASGKTTLAEKLASAFPCNVFHMDDFFLRPEQRTKERYDEPGGNVDRERFLREVLLPVKQNEPFSYRPFSCRTMSLCEPISVTPADITIIEGTYSCHPELQEYYDLCIFLTVSPEVQIQRISQRSTADTAAFLGRWIPLEELYFEKFKIKEKCDLVFTS